MPFFDPKSSHHSVEFQSRLQTLQETPIFSSIDLETLKLLVHLTDKITLPQACPILNPSDSINQLYILMQGQVQLQTNQVTLAKLSRGACFGQLTFGAPTSITVSITTLVPTQILILHATQINAAVHTHPEYRSQLLTALYQLHHRQPPWQRQPHDQLASMTRI